MTLIAELAELVNSRGSREDVKEHESEAHNLYRSEPGHEHKSKAGHEVNGIKAPGSTGVMYVSERAAANGWTAGHPEWANFGQGAPEVGVIPDASPRVNKIDFNAMGEGCFEYAPTTGVPELREAVAKLYNADYRKGKKSQYTMDNVCITPGGRAGLTRVASVIDEVFVSYQIPDYTAYDQMLSSFDRLVPIPSALEEADAYHLNVKKLRKDVREQGLSVVLASNPRNPTGTALIGDELRELVGLAQQEGTTLILDEFYSYYLYDGEEGASVSAAEYVEDVDEDPVILIQGLTKAWRYPGWRCAWVVGPKPLIKALGQCGGFLDGGASHPLQLAAVPLLEPSRVQQDRVALQRHFKQKRDHVLGRLEKMGFNFKSNRPSSTFYIWLDLSGLPSPLNSGLVFFEELLKEKVIVVPGIFFDINPKHRRSLYSSPCHHFIRLSYGPELDQLDRGLDGMERLLKRVGDEVRSGRDLHDVVGRDLKSKSDL